MKFAACRKAKIPRMRPLFRITEPVVTLELLRALELFPVPTVFQKATLRPSALAVLKKTEVLPIKEE
jgi:hypothetical protein